MPSPLPGMDPYLEGYLWPDVHAALANKIRQQLAPQIRPRYVARLEIYVVEDSAPEAEIGIMYPDVEIMRSVRPTPPPERAASGAAITSAPLVLPVLAPVEVRVPTVEIRDVASNHLVTCIEILSPVNKREPGASAYRQKRQRLHHAGVHLLEIDLLRRGIRPIAHPRLPERAYLIALTRAQSSQMSVWPLGLDDPLPVAPVPLQEPDGDVALDLASALGAVYEEAGYDLSVDYRESPPPPELSPDDSVWLDGRLRQAGLR